MQDVAQVIRSGIVPEVVCVDSEGWDTHINMGMPDGRVIPGVLGDFAATLDTFVTDLGPDIMARTTIIAMTEFGRTADQNGSGGTDHGYGSTMIALGAGVHGGQVVGRDVVEASDVHGIEIAAHDVEAGRGEGMDATAAAESVADGRRAEAIFGQHLGTRDDSEAGGAGKILPEPRLGAPGTIAAEARRPPDAVKLGLRALTLGRQIELAFEMHGSAVATAAIGFQHLRFSSQGWSFR